jgi:hypothetical protein
MPRGVTVGAQGAQVPRLVRPAQLARQDVIDLGGDRPAHRAQEPVAPEHLQPQPPPRPRRSALRAIIQLECTAVVLYWS